MIADATENPVDPVLEPAVRPVPDGEGATASDDATVRVVARYALSALLGAVVGIAENCAALRARSREDD